MKVPVLMRLRSRYQNELVQDARLRDHLAVIATVNQAIGEGKYPFQVVRILANLSENQWIQAITGAVKHCKGEDEIVAFFFLSSLREGLRPEGVNEASQDDVQGG